MFSILQNKKYKKKKKKKKKAKKKPTTNFRGVLSHKVSLVYI